MQANFTYLLYSCLPSCNWCSIVAIDAPFESCWRSCCFFLPFFLSFVCLYRLYVIFPVKRNATTTTIAEDCGSILLFVLCCVLHFFSKFPHSLEKWPQKEFYSFSFFLFFLFFSASVDVLDAASNSYLKLLCLLFAICLQQCIIYIHTYIHTYIHIYINCCMHNCILDCLC